MEPRDIDGFYDDWQGKLARLAVKKHRSRQEDDDLDAYRACQASAEVARLSGWLDPEPEPGEEPSEPWAGKRRSRRLRDRL